MRFDDLKKIFDEFRKTEAEEIPSGIIARTDGGYLALSSTSDGGTLSLFESKPVAHYDFYSFWAARAVVGRHDASFGISRDVDKCSAITRRTIIAIQSRFEFLQNHQLQY